MGNAVSIAQLDIALRGNTQNLDANLNRAGAGLGKFKQVVNQQSAAINTSLSSLGSGAGAAFENALTNPISVLKSAVSSIGQALLHPFDTLKSGVGGLLSTFMSIGSAIRGSVIGAVRSLASVMKTAVNPMAWISGFQNIASAAMAAIPSVLALDLALAPIDLALGALAAIAVVAGGAVLGLAGAGLYLANQQAEVMASSQKLASTLGMSTQVFSAIAGVTGMGADELSNSMAHLERTLVDAATSGGATAQALQRVGLSAQELRNMTPEDQLGKLANALQGVSSQADRVKISAELFGKSGGQEMLRVLQNGTQGLNELLQKADKFGLSFSASEAETVRKSGKIWGEWKLYLQGIGNQLALAFSGIWADVGGIMSSVFGKISEWVKAATPFITQFWNVFKAACLFGWDIAKLVWAGIVSVWEVSMNFLSSIFGPWIEIVRGWFNSITDTLGINRGAFTSWKEGLMIAALSLEFAFKNWERIFTLIIDLITLKALQWSRSFRATLESMKNNAVSYWTIAKEAAVDYWDAALGRNVRQRTCAPLTNAIAGTISGAERELEERLRANLTALGGDLNAFLQERMNQGNAVVDNINRAASNMGAVADKPNKGAERGSVEAFAIITSDKGDRMWNAVNAQLVEMRQANALARRLLEEQRRRPGIVAARV